MSEAAVTTSKGRGGRGKKTKDDVEEVEKTPELEIANNKKGAATKRKNVGKKEEEPIVEENGQTEATVTAVPPKKGGRGTKGKAVKTIDDDAEEIGDGDNDAPVETQPPKRASRTRKEVVYKEVDEDIDNKKKRGAAKPEAKPAAPKKGDKKSTKSKATVVKTKKKADSEEEDEEEDEQKDSGDDEIEEADEEKEERATPAKAVADEDDNDDMEEEEEIPPTKKARGGRSKPAAKKDSDKPTAVAEKASRKRGGKKNEEVSAGGRPKVEEQKHDKSNGDPILNVKSKPNEKSLSVVTKQRKRRNDQTKSNTPELEIVTIESDKVNHKKKLKQNMEEDPNENNPAQNVTIRKNKTTSKRKKDTSDGVNDEKPSEVKQMKSYELVPVEKEYTLKISTWNVAGIRAWFGKGGLEFINRENPDIICLQETKCLEEDMPDVAKIVGYHPYYLCKTGGYAGIAIYSKIMPMKIEYGIGDPEFDEQGRIMTAEFEKFFLICVYVPNSGRKLVNLKSRMRWNKLFLEFVGNMDKTLSKPVIICGDMNVSHLEIDLANPKTNKRSAGFTQEERDDLSSLLDTGFVDTFRHLYPDKTECYTYWTYMANARARNVGWRLDYFIVSKRMISRIVDNVIRSNVHGSDHCPVTLFLNMNKPLVSN